MAKDPILLSTLFSLLKPSAIRSESEVEAPIFVEDPVRWKELFRLAAGLSSLDQVAYVLDRASWKGQIPAAVRAEIDESVIKQKLKFSILQREINWALTFFSEAKVPVILSGGFELGSRFYSDRFSRPLTDIEFIVLPHQVLSAQMALGKGDYRLKSETGGRLLSRGLGGPRVLLRSGIFSKDRVEENEAIFERAHVLGAPHVMRRISVLSPTDVFLDLLQKAKLGGGLKHPQILNDLHFVMRSNSVDWKLCAKLWNSQGWSSFADHALRFLNSTWETELPPEFETKLSRGWLGPIRERFFTRSPQLPE